MATSSSLTVSHLKGLRTRYFNLLSREMDIARGLQQHEVDEDNLDKHMKQVSSTRTKLQNFSAKFEDVSERYISVLSATEFKTDEETLIKDQEQILDFTEKVTECFADLTVYEGELTSQIHAKSSHEPSGLEKHIEKLTELQSQLLIQTTQLITSHHNQSAQFQSSHSTASHPPSSIRLPQLEIPVFSGNILNWKDFWDSFQVAVDNNSSLSPVEKLTYLKSKLLGSAISVIAGLSISNENYPVALKLLHDRYGNQQTAINAHYAKLMDVSSSTNYTGKLRIFYDTIEKHLRSLEALGQNTDQQLFVSMIFSKLPKDVILQLEIQKPSEQWTVQSLRNSLRVYITAREVADNHYTQAEPTQKTLSSHFVVPTDKYSPKSSTEALVANGNQTTSKSKNPNSGCKFCGQSHWSDECKVYPDVESRKQKIKGLCFICFRKGHGCRDCDSNKACFHCQQRKNHHRSLCPKMFKSSFYRTEPANLTVPCDPSTSITEPVMMASGEVVMMQTATTSIRNPETYSSDVVRLLLDSGSHRTYVTENLVKKLNLKIGKVKEEISIVTFGSQNPKVITAPTVSLQIQLKDGSYMTISANVVPQITGPIHRIPVNLQSCESWIFLWLNNSLADTFPNEPQTSNLDILIGNDYYLDIILPDKIQVIPGLYLLGSRLGWILSGRMTSSTDKESEISMLVLTFGQSVTSQAAMFCHPDQCLPLKPNLEEFWSLETIGIKDPLPDPNDEKALQRFNETIYLNNTRYYVTWPWKDNNTDLPDNKALAIGRLRSLISKLGKFPELLEKYNLIIKDQEQKGIIEKVTRESTNNLKHYIPHHAVLTPGKTTTKLRIVYDASAKHCKDNNSLNECLYRGPVILNDLCGLLLRFRTHSIAVIADIEKAFLQVGLQQEERDVTRFFWLKDPTTLQVNNNLETYRFQRIPFGIVSSPFLLSATILYHLNKANTLVSQQIKQNLYVDNLITGCDSLNEANSFYSESKELFKSASMNLREWASNSNEFVEQVPQIDRYERDTINVLGIVWNMKLDILTIVCPSLQECVAANTKRGILRVLSSIFDPLGISTPVTLQAKLFLQDLWREKLEWDKPLSAEHRSKWDDISRSLATVTNLVFHRFVGYRFGEQKVSCQLLCFCDASARAFSAAVYLRMSYQNQCQVRLVFAKSRLAPINGITLPRLELLAVLIGVRCLNFVQQQLKLDISSRIVWTDSQCVLHWVKSVKPQPVFIENRLKEIRKDQDLIFRYVPSADNPADLATRGHFSHQNRGQYGPHLLLPHDKMKQITMNI